MRLSLPVIDYLTFLVSEKSKSVTVVPQRILAQCQEELAYCLRESRHKKQVPLEYSRKDW